MTLADLLLNRFLLVSKIDQPFCFLEFSVIKYGQELLLFANCTVYLCMRSSPVSYLCHCDTCDVDFNLDDLAHTSFQTT